MKIVIAPDSFKEGLSARQVADAIARGFAAVFPTATLVVVPMADGGEGTLQSLVDATGGSVVTREVVGPNGDPVTARFGLSSDAGLAFIEMAAASGLALVAPERRDPRRATSYGTGQLIRAALDAGARRLVIGIGGSATNDGGAGMLQALGARLLDAQGREIDPGGAALVHLARIDLSGLDARLADCRLEVACDVTNPLVGPEGASAVFGPQKGATPAMVRELDAALRHFASVVKTDLGRDVADVPGGGAAGGLGAALLGVLGAGLHRGAELVIDTLGLKNHLEGADLVVTGEGRTDGQTAFGKAPLGVARAAAARGVPVVLLSGALTADAAALHHHGIAAMFGAVQRPCDLAAALRDAEANLQTAAYNIASVLKLGMSMGD